MNLPLLKFQIALGLLRFTTNHEIYTYEKQIQWASKLNELKLELTQVFWQRT